MLDFVIFVTWWKINLAIFRYVTTITFMRDARDPGTLEMPLFVKRPRGRPRTGRALSNAERQRAFRQRRKAAYEMLLASAVALMSGLAGERSAKD